jgi:hypothetical protein
MQQAQVGFDPISIRTVLPWQSRIFFLYLFVVSVLWLVRSLGLFWQLGFLAAFQRKSPSIPAGESDQAQFLAASALANRLPEFIGSDPQKTPLLRLANLRFYLLWETCWMKVSSLKRLARLTLISTIFIFAWLAAIGFTEVSYSKVIGIGALSGGFAELFVLLTNGMAVCLVLYITSGFYEAALTKRKVLWNYICQKSNVETAT